MAETRIALFMELIRDHPVDTYNGTDLQAFIAFLKYETGAFTAYFVLHNLMVVVGFGEWGKSRGNNFIFPQILKSAYPSKRASQIMQRLRPIGAAQAGGLQETY